MTTAQQVSVIGQALVHGLRRILGDIGPFPSEDLSETGEKLREIGQEYGATTGRPRRCGWLDAVTAKYSIRLNGFTAIAKSVGLPAAIATKLLLNNRLTITGCHIPTHPAVYTMVLKELMNIGFKFKEKIIPIDKKGNSR